MNLEQLDNKSSWTTHGTPQRQVLGAIYSLLMLYQVYHEPEGTPYVEIVAIIKLQLPNDAMWWKQVENTEDAQKDYQHAIPNNYKVMGNMVNGALLRIAQIILGGKIRYLKHIRTTILRCLAFRQSLSGIPVKFVIGQQHTRHNTEMLYKIGRKHDFNEDEYVKQLNCTYSVKAAPRVTKPTTRTVGMGHQLGK